MVVSLPLAPKIAVYPPGATFGPRLLRDYEFVWLIEGNAHYWFAQGGEEQSLALPQGSLLLCRPQFRDRFVWDKKHSTRHGFFHFSLLEGDATWPTPDDWPLMRPIREGDLLDTLSRHLVNGTPHGSLSQRNLMAATFLAAFLSGETQIHPPPTTYWPEPVERAVAFMYAQSEKEGTAKLELDTLAQAAYVSPEYLCRLFKKSLGYSPMEVARLIRMERATLLLSRSNYTVAQVAHLTGFESPFHFSRLIKKVYGLTPYQMQKATRLGETVPPSPLRLLWEKPSQESL